MEDLWWNKYKPSTLEEFVCQNDEIRNKILSWKKTPSKLPHLILTGPYGTGKTSLGHIIKNELGVDDADFLYINSALKSGADVVRNEIVDFCEAGGWSGLKIVMLDEAERLTKDAQLMLRGVLQDYSSVARFIFTCNDIRNITDGLKAAGRCKVMEIDSLDEGAFTDRLINICVQENVELDTEEKLEILGTLVVDTYPNLRRAINELEDMVVDGVLVGKQTKAVVKASWEEGIVDFLTNDSSIGNVMELVIAVNKDEMEEVYSFLFRNAVGLFGEENAHEAIYHISEGIYKNGFHSRAEITLCNTLLKLQPLIVSKEA